VINLKKKIIDPNIYGMLTVNILRGMKFPKNDTTRLEVGLARTDNGSWVGPQNVKKKLHKASETPSYNIEFSGVWSRGQFLKIVVYGKGIMDLKEYTLGTSTLDYHFFRAWYITGKTLQERRIALESTHKSLDCALYITVKYDGISLAPDKEILGFTAVDMKLGAKGLITSINTEIDNAGKEIGDMVSDDVAQIKRDVRAQVSEEEKHDSNVFDKVEKKFNKIFAILISIFFEILLSSMVKNVRMNTKWTEEF